MTHELGMSVYQSGEKVTSSGLYEIVNIAHDQVAAQHRTLLLQHGELFPNYEGRAACWYLVQVVDEQPHIEAINTPWQTGADE